MLALRRYEDFIIRSEFNKTAEGNMINQPHIKVCHVTGEVRRSPPGQMKEGSDRTAGGHVT